MGGRLLSDIIGYLLIWQGDVPLAVNYFHVWAPL